MKRYKEEEVDALYVTKSNELREELGEERLKGDEDEEEDLRMSQLDSMRTMG